MIRQLVLILALTAMVLGLPAYAQGRPNVVLFICDDMTWSDAGCYGNEQISTPNIDLLATQGMRFTACYTSTAMCAPTRQQLYTGLWPVRSGAYPNHSQVQPGTRSLGHHFGDLGYRVAIAGKRHFGPRASYPFEQLRGGREHDGGNNPAQDFSVEAVTEYITRDADQPYFLICATNQPHSPWNRGDAEVYDPDDILLPPYYADTPQTRATVAAYYAEITYMDELLGEVMDAVDEAGQADNTIFIFTSEQGAGLPFAKWTCYEAGLRTALIVRWPDRVQAGSLGHALVQYVDIVPTLLDAAGADPATIDTGRPGAPDGGQGFDGESFLPVLLGQADAHREWVYGIHTTRGIINGSDCYAIRSVCDGRYKLILNLNHQTPFQNIVMRPNNEVWPSWIAAAEEGDEHAARLVDRYQHRPAVELYDLDDDPHEFNNLAGTEPHAQIQAGLTEALQAWMAQQGDEGTATEMLVAPRR